MDLLDLLARRWSEFGPGGASGSDCTLVESNRISQENNTSQLALKYKLAQNHTWWKLYSICNIVVNMIWVKQSMLCWFIEIRKLFSIHMHSESLWFLDTLIYFNVHRDTEAQMVITMKQHIEQG